MTKTNWQKVKLKDVANYVHDKVEIKLLNLSNYISTENLLPNRGGATVSNNLSSVRLVSSYMPEDILISNIRPYFKKIYFPKNCGGCSNDILVIRNNEKYNSKFLYHVLSDGRFFNYATTTAKGTKMPRGDKGAIMQYRVPCPPLPTQQKIVAILSAFDDKIELNDKINANLEAQAQALFKRWFEDFEFPDDNDKPYKSNGGKMVQSEMGLIPKGWKISNLTSIATYLNGLAMQKYRPQEDEKGIPVLKIKELGQGKCDHQSDLCSKKIETEYIINDGDVIFSWSGTLMINIWCGGECGLNQHLFKVYSENFLKWFYFYWTKHYLNQFIQIAKDKAVTMGHIKRENLEKSKIFIPDSKMMRTFNNVFSPIFDQIINNKISNRILEKNRDALLPKLINGEIEV